MVLVITSDRMAQLREALSAAISHQPSSSTAALIFSYYSIIVLLCVCVCVCVGGVHSTVCPWAIRPLGDPAASWKLEAESAPKQWAFVEARQGRRVL